MLTSFPSATAFALALGAGSPCADEPCAGTLGLPATGTLTLLIATHVSMCTSDTSSRPHDRPSPAYGTLRYRLRGQMTDVRCQKAHARSHPHLPEQTLQHLRDLAILLTPASARSLHRVAEIETIAAPQPHLVGRAHGHRPETRGTPACTPPAGRTLRPGWRRSTCSRAGSAPPAPAARSPASPDSRRWTSKDNRYASLNTSRSSKPLGAVILATIPSDVRPPDTGPHNRHQRHLSSDICHLTSEPRSFGAWLEPRYIFGAGQLFDQ